MVLAEKYLVRINTEAEFQFDYFLQVKEFLRHIDKAVASNPIRVYKVVFTLNTTTHYVTKTEVEITEW